MLDLKRPIYLATAAYGHFGRSDIDLTWEKTDKAGDIGQQKKFIQLKGALASFFYVKCMQYIEEASNGK